MSEFLILFMSGLFSFATGIIYLKKEIRLFKDAHYTTAKVAKYYDYQSTSNNRKTMYTMAVEYMLMDGTVMHARQQSGSTRRKYQVGTKLNIMYSREKPELFIVEGDHSRKIALVGMIIAGVLLMALSIYVGLV